MARIYLGLNGVIYLALGLWCTLDVDGTASAMGYTFARPSARVEYLTVYGGLELGLALFYMVCAASRSRHETGLLFSICYYPPLALFRWGSLIVIGSPGGLNLALGSVEAVLAVAAVALWTMRR